MTDTSGIADKIARDQALVAARRGDPAASSMRRFQGNAPIGVPVVGLTADHPAVIEGRTLFPSRVREVAPGRRILISGHNSRKIGKYVLKGKLRGAPIYTLTLEERATCSTTCFHWRDCFGNKMQWPNRWVPGAALEQRLGEELRELARLHRRGFLVRLHVLGDFYSADYVRRWEEWLRTIPPLHIFGYTAWPIDSDIGSAIRLAKTAYGSRFAIRYSNGSVRGHSTVSVPLADVRAGKVLDAVICPGQTGQSDCCGSCALCWSADRDIAFLVH